MNTRGRTNAAAGARPRYTVAEKLEILRFARSNSARAACERFHVARSSIHLWSKQEQELLQQTRHQHLQRDAEGYEALSAVPTAVNTTAPSPQAACEQPENISIPQGTNSASTEVDGASPNCFVTAPTGPGELAPSTGSSTEQTPVISLVLPPEREGPVRATIVGYQGAECGFSHTAAQRSFAQFSSAQDPNTASFDPTGYPQASHVLDALQKHEIDLAFIATDALLSNTNHAALDQIVASQLKLVGEVVVQEDADVCALPGTELCDVDCVISDWPTLQRYEQYIVHIEKQYNKKIYRQVTWDSSAGCRLVWEERAENTLVLCTTLAATTHGLVVLQGRLPGSPTHTRYSVLGRQDAVPLKFMDVELAPTPIQTTTQCTLLVKGTARAILDIISAFAYRGLEILSFHTRGGEEQQLRSYVISYRGSSNPAIESGLQYHLSAASERVIVLGNFMTHALKKVA